MKIKNSMLVVKDLEKSKAVYWEVLGLRTLSDIDIHAVLTGGLALQTEESWKGFVGKEISIKEMMLKSILKRMILINSWINLVVLKPSNMSIQLWSTHGDKESCAFMIPIITS